MTMKLFAVTLLVAYVVGLASGGCTFEGQEFSVGDTYSPDGCNTCTCTLGGESACTEKACLCENGFSPLPNDTCGGNPVLQCQTEGYDCDFSNVPTDVSDPNAFGMCCKEEPCIVNEEIYESGESFYDRCNLCTCSNGTPLCSRMPCLPRCYREGQGYPVGVEVPTDDPCEHCTCSENENGFQIICDIQDCAPCYNPTFIDGQCCPVCTEEPCIVNEEIYESGESFYDRCNLCTCSNGTPLCSRMPCLPRCYREGQGYPVGVEVPTDDPCEHCTCSENENGFQIICTLQDCAPCYNPTFIDGQCCPVCTEEPCIVNGVTYESGETFYNKCNRCYCFNGSAACTRKGCRCKGCYREGKHYAVGENVPRDDPCLKCQCTKDASIICESDSCDDECEDPEIVEGVCCPVCPEATCQYDGITIYPGPPVDVGGCCECTCIFGETQCDCDDECP